MCTWRHGEDLGRHTFSILVVDGNGTAANASVPEVVCFLDPGSFSVRIATRMLDQDPHNYADHTRAAPAREERGVRGGRGWREEKGVEERRWAAREGGE